MSRRIEVWGVEPETLLAEGLVPSDGSVGIYALRGWFVYPRLSELENAIKETGLPARVYTVGDVAARAFSNALQDRCENIPYGSVVHGIAAGGPAPPRESWQAPEWVAPSERDLYLQEYARAIAEILGVEP